MATWPHSLSVIVIQKLRLTNQQARRFILHYQGLLGPRRLEDKSDICQFIKKVGCIQFDPLDRVGTNPHLALQARVKEYEPELLEELLYDDRELIDNWDKNMSIYHRSDWPYFQRYREKSYEKLEDREVLIDELIPRVREEIGRNGPLCSSDLDFDRKVDWSWSPTRGARAALESMYSWGELIIHHKSRGQKYYDFAENHLPGSLLEKDDPNETLEDYYRWYVKRRIGSIGLIWSLSGGAWLGIDGLKKDQRMKALSRLVEEGEIVKVGVEGIRHDFYIPKNALDLLEEISTYDKADRKVRFIAPLDNVLWDRKMVKRLFDFEYVWEVYKPSSERRYGYYVLPVLYGDKFVARFEPIFDSEKGELFIKNWWWESGQEMTKELEEKLSYAFDKFLDYLGGNKIRLGVDKGFNAE